jgi:uncharacterized protein YcfJ
MKKAFVFILCAGVVFLSLGCQSAKTRAPEGAGIGGALGALAGGIIGHQSGHGGEGVAIGAAAGAVTGAIVGSQIDKPAQAQAVEQITISQVVELSQQGSSDEAIIAKIRNTSSKFALDASDIAYLKQKGVSQKVIDAMQGE